MIAAFVIGLVGSLHCVGMCGPLMLTMTQKRSWLGFSVYHVGRMLVYIGWGLFFGLIGFSTHLLGIQEVVSWILGTIIIVVFIVSSWRNRLEKWYLNSSLYQFVKQSLTSRISPRNRSFVAGLLNGFLPCGLTYLAVGYSVLASSLWGAVGIMAAFGLGTLPLLIVTKWGYLKMRGFSVLTKKLTPVIGMIAGFLLILRADWLQSEDLITRFQDQMIRAVTYCGQIL